MSGEAGEALGDEEAGFLVARFRAEPDGSGKLTVIARVNGFAGRGSAWFDGRSLLRFADELCSYPLPEPGPSIAGGFGSPERPDVLIQEHVRLEARLVTAVGQLALTVHLATEAWPSNRQSPRGDATFELFTTHEQLRRFGRELARVVGGELAEAHLQGELLAP